MGGDVLGTDGGSRRARVRAAVVDEVLVAGATLLVFAMAASTGATGMVAFALARLLGPRVPGEGVVGGLLLAGTWLAVRLVYGVLGEGGPTAASPGKRLAGLGVVDGSLRAPGYRRALVRHTVKAVMVISVVGVVAAVAGRSWHDAAAGTRVVTRCR